MVCLLEPSKSHTPKSIIFQRCLMYRRNCSYFLHLLLWNTKEFHGTFARRGNVHATITSPHANENLHHPETRIAALHRQSSGIFHNTPLLGRYTYNPVGEKKRTDWSRNRRQMRRLMLKENTDMFNFSNILWKGEFENRTARPFASVTKQTSSPLSSASC